MPDSKAFLAEKARKTEAALAEYLDSWTGAPAELLDAIRYSLFAGGKRFRPALALGAAEVIAGDDAPALPAACALEMIHTYSLIHDDLPAMDNDDLRRGKPTSHKVYGEATAILAGDTLLTMAFDVASRPGNPVIIRELAQASGVTGMAGGQFLDLQSEGKTLTLEELKRIHAAKTGALIRASLRMGAILAHAAPEPLEALSRYGEHLGLAFQVADDILDVIGDEALIGKPVGSDVTNAKATYPAIAGLECAQKLAQESANEAVAALASFGPEAGNLRSLAQYVVARDS